MSSRRGHRDTMAPVIGDRCTYAGSYKSIGAPIARHTAHAIASTAVQLFRGWAAAAGPQWAVSGLSLSAYSFSGAAAGSGDLRLLFSSKRTPSQPKMPLIEQSALPWPKDEQQRRMHVGFPSEVDEASRDAVPVATPPAAGGSRSHGAAAEHPHLCGNAAQRVDCCSAAAGESTGVCTSMPACAIHQGHCSPCRNSAAPSWPRPELGGSMHVADGV